MGLPWLRALEDLNVALNAEDLAMKEQTRRETFRSLISTMLWYI